MLIESDPWLNPSKPVQLVGSSSWRWFRGVDQAALPLDELDELAVDEAPEPVVEEDEDPESPELDDEPLAAVAGLFESEEPLELDSEPPELDPLLLASELELSFPRESLR
jgi:hypothetical protein